MPSAFAVPLTVEPARSRLTNGIVLVGSAVALWAAGGGGHELLPLAFLVMASSFSERIGEVVQRQDLELQAAAQSLAVQAERERRANQAKTMFLAHMSHEIRTPLNALIGTLELAERDQQGGERQALLHLANQSAGGLRDLLNDILDVSKIEAGEMALDESPTSLDELARAIVGTYGALALDRGIDLGVKVDPALSPWGISDPVRLRQILFNLVHNAIKFTEHGQVLVRFEAEGTDRLVCSVADTGIGIPRDHLASVFEPFRQADATTTRAFGGTGLGLTLVRRLTTMLGGEVSVDSELGRGTRFTLTLPWREAEPRETLAAPDSTPLFARVLVAEDNQVNQFVVRRLLEQMGCHVIVVSNGDDAVRVGLQEGFDLVLMDCHMPVMDGFEATRRLREGGFTKPIVALTASALLSDRERCLESGMERVLTKPLDPADLRLAVAGSLPGAGAAEAEAHR